MTDDELLEVGLAAAQAGAEELLSRFGGRQRALSSKSTPTDPVSEADLAAERAIRAVLSERRPDDGVLGEEGGEDTGASGLRWVIDPLDGTVNYLFGVPQWAVSVACEAVGGEGRIGVVLDPARGETWTVVAGGPPRLDGEPVEGSRREDLAHALVATGFGYDPEVRRVQGETVAALLPRVRDVRRLGSASLDLAWTAAGRFDAYYERGVKAWDIAAGRLMCRQAGLAVEALAPAPPQEAGVLVAAPALIDELRPLVA